MACKKKYSEENVEVKEKTLQELSDSEFMERVEKLSVPLYKDYLNAPRCADVLIDGYLSATDIGILAENAKIDIEEPKANKNEPVDTVCNRKVYDKKRILFPILIALFSLVLLVSVAVGIIGKTGLDHYIAMFVGKTDIDIAEPVIAAINYHLNLGLETEFIKFFDSAYTWKEFFPVYAVAAAALIYVICIVVAFIKSMACIFASADKDGFYKKYRFGALGLIMFLLSLIILAGGFYLSGNGFDDIIGFVLPGEAGASGLTAGYALLAMIIIPILVMICSGLSYRRKK